MVADDDAGRPQQARSRGAATAHGAGPRDVDSGPGLGASLHEAVEGSREDVREKRQIADLLHGLVTVRELQQLEVRIGNKKILGLSAVPAAQVEAVGSGIGVRVAGLADLGTTVAAVTAAAASHVEGNRDQVAFLQKLDVRADFHDFPGHLMPHDHAFRGGEGPAVDVEVTAADVGSHDL